MRSRAPPLSAKAHTPDSLERRPHFSETSQRFTCGECVWRKLRQIKVILQFCAENSNNLLFSLHQGEGSVLWLVGHEESIPKDQEGGEPQTTPVGARLA